MFYFVYGQLPPEVCPEGVDFVAARLSVLSHDYGELPSSYYLLYATMIQVLRNLQRSIGTDQRIIHLGKLILMGNLQIRITAPPIQISHSI